MGALRERMAVDLRLRGLSPVTQRLYLRCAERFVAYHRRSPTALKRRSARFSTTSSAQRVSRSTHGVYVAAIHFLYWGHPGCPRGGAAHPVPPPGDRAIAGDPEPRGGRAALVHCPPVQAPCDADGGLRGRPPGERAVCAVPDRHRQSA